jgi:diguanylate cyclase (GGDEF)-like protein
VGRRDVVGTIEAAFAAAERRLTAVLRQGDPARRDDPDTGLHSRQTAMRRGRDEITRARRNHHPLAVAVISLDIGPPAEDPRGRGQQERALRLAAEIAMQGLRAYDTVARWEHDVFLAIIPEAEIENAVAAVERLRTMLADAPAIRAGEAAPAVHGGVAVLQPDDATIAEIAARAARALARARSGVGAAVQAAPGPRQRPTSLTSV